MASGLRAVTRWVPLAAVVGTVCVAIASVLALAGLAQVAAWYVAQLAIPVSGALGFIATLGYTLVRRRWRSGACLATMATSLAVAVAGGSWTFAVVPVPYPSTLEDSRPAATIRVPLDGPVRVGWGGDSLETNYHAASPDQRWAYDLLVEPYLVGSDRLEDYGCYGRDVLAPASGVVVMATDGAPDHPPGEPSNEVERPAGNAVGIRLDATGTHLVLAHLAPGSLAVAVGDRVREGQRLGRCGNSGNTSEPHVHVHHQRQDPSEVPFGFAEGLPLYFRDHGGDPMPAGGLEERDGEPRPTGAVIEHRGR